MLIGVDKQTLSAVKNKKDYIYIFNKEPLKELIDLGMHCIYYKNIDYVDINLTNYDIDCIKKANIRDKDYDKLPPQKDFKIAIIIPNYNYEHTIEKCLNSVLNQTYNNYEIIFVDDMSTDNSVEIAYKTYQKYLYDTYGYYDDTCTKEKMKVIQLQQKRYNGGARNEGYLYLSDDVDYVWYVDSDDWLKDEYVLEKINQKLQMKPDVLFVGWAKYEGKEEETAFIPEYKDRYEAILGWSGSCGKVIKKELAIRQECLYNEGTLKEDKNQHRKICIYMNSFANLREPVYVWNRTNSKSVTTVREKVVWGTSTIRHYADTLQLYLSVEGRDSRMDDILRKKVQETRQEMLNGGDSQL